MTRAELHDLIHSAARILRRQISTRSEGDALTRLEKLLLSDEERLRPPDPVPDAEETEP